MKKFALLMALCLTLCAAALAETVQGNGFSITLPDDFRVCTAEEVAAFFADAEADVESELEMDEAASVDTDRIFLAVSEAGGGSVSVITDDAEDNTAEGYEAAAREVYELTTGNAVTASGLYEQPNTELKFLSFTVSLYNSEISEYFIVVDGIAYNITFTNVNGADIETMLSGFAIE